MKKKYTHDEIVEKIRAVNPNIEILSKIVKIADKVKAMCKIDGHVWHPYVQNLLNGHGCPVCAGTKKVTEDEFKARVADILPNIQIIGSLTNLKSPIEVKCLTCGTTWSPLAESLYRGHGCPKCAGKQRKMTEEIKAELAISRPDVEMLGEYHSAHEKIPYRFLECGHICQISTAKIKSGRGCPKCAEALRGASQRGSKEQLQALLDQKFGDVEVCGDYVNNTTPVLFRCRRCGHEWSLTPKEIKISLGCPECHKTGTSFVQEFVLAFMVHALPEERVLSRDKNAIGKELDIFIPGLCIAIEPGSWYWHADKVDSDSEKARRCLEAGIELIFLFDHYPEDTSLLPGTLVTRNNLSDPHHFDELVQLCYEILARTGITAAFSDEELESIRAEAYRASLGVTSELFKAQVERVNPKIEVLGEYQGKNLKVLVKCRDCGREWESLARNLIRPTACPHCRCLRFHSQAEFEEALAERHPCMEALDEYVDQATKIRFRCTRRNIEQAYEPSYLLSNRGCRQCHNVPTGDV